MYSKSMFSRTTPEDLREYLAFKRRGSAVPAKKEKGSYKRKSKYPQRFC